MAVAAAGTPTHTESDATAELYKGRTRGLVLEENIFNMSKKKTGDSNKGQGKSLESEVLSGVQGGKPRWEVCLNSTPLGAHP